MARRSGWKSQSWRSRRRSQRRLQRSKRHRARRIERQRTYRGLVAKTNEGVSASKRTPFPTQLCTFDVSGDLRFGINPDFVVQQANNFLQIPGLGIRPVRVLINLQAVTAIDAGALLVLCSRIMLLGECALVPRVSVEFPSHGPVRKALQEAGISYFLRERGRETLEEDDDSNIHIIDGFVARDRAIKTEVAARIRDFLSKRHAALEREERQLLYLAAQECIENVGLHAYESPAEQRHVLDPPRVWIVVGLFDNATKISTVAIIDLGVGVVGSIKRKPDFIQIVKDFMRGNNAADIIEAATSGLRTESQERKHGKGLSTMRQFVEMQPNRRLSVLSSGGLVTCSSSGVSKRAMPQFLGTLVVLEVGDSGTSI